MKLENLTCCRQAFTGLALFDLINGLMVGITKLFLKLTISQELGTQRGS